MSSIATPGGAVAPQSNVPNSKPGPRSTWRRRRGRHFRALLSCCLLASCSSDSSVLVQPPTEIDLSNATLEVTAGADQEGVVGAMAPEALVVTVRAADGTPIAGAPVWWTFAQGRGQGRGKSQKATTIQVTTDASGQATVDWELGTRAGLQTASADLDPPSASLVAEGPALAPKEGQGRKGGFRTRAKPAKAAEILLSVDSLVLEVGEQMMVTATVVDQYGNVIPDAVIEWQSSDPTVATVGEPAPAPVVQVTE